MALYYLDSKNIRKLLLLIILFSTLSFLKANAADYVKLEGKITDLSGKPIAGAQVRLQPDNHQTRSNENGMYIFPKLFAGRYQLEVSFIGYKTISVSVLINKEEILIKNIILEQTEQILSEVSVKATKNNIDNVLQSSQSAQLVMTISKERIAEMGSRRLDEVLREQTGIAVVSDLGNGNRTVGIQMQGFSSDYITILLNGQPMGGRHSGNFDLSRISVTDIERIEVIKGASCSFYGSEALGGTINIITKQNINEPQLYTGITQGSFATTDATLSAETPFNEGNGFVYISGNYYSTDGFNVNPYLENGKTSPPYHSFNLQSRSRWKFNRSGALNFTARYADRHSNMSRDYGSMPTSDVLDETDFNAMLSLDKNLESGHRLLSRYYFNSYASLQDVRFITNGNLLQQNNFTEYIHRFEQQHNFRLTYLNLTITSGLGGDYQLNKAEVEDTGGNMLNYFTYSQTNWNPSEKFNAVLGFRYDGNTTYGGKLNPTAGITYKPFKWLDFNTSIGTGYKAPTYRQLYQRFTNLAGGGYTVLGTSNIENNLAEMQSSGDIQQIWNSAAQVKDLKAERSSSFNITMNIKPNRFIDFNINGFYNSIHNLIISQQIGVKSNGSQLFSWFNIAEMYSQGIESSLRIQLYKGLSLTTGYQFLDMKDKTVIDSIKNKTGDFAYVRGETGIREAKVSDYYGLPNRSRHSGNIQLNYYHNPWKTNISVRAIYRGKYGFMDVDNNGYIDQYDIFVAAHTLINASIQKKFIDNRLNLRFTIDNITNYTDYLMPNLAGRMFLIGVGYTLK